MSGFRQHGQLRRGPPRAYNDKSSSSTNEQHKDDYETSPRPTNRDTRQGAQPSRERSPDYPDSDTPAIFRDYQFDLQKQLNTRQRQQNRGRKIVGEHGSENVESRRSPPRGAFRAASRDLITPAEQSGMPDSRRYSPRARTSATYAREQVDAYESFEKDDRPFQPRSRSYSRGRPYARSSVDRESDRQRDFPERRLNSNTSDTFAAAAMSPERIRNGPSQRSPPYLAPHGRTFMSNRRGQRDHSPRQSIDRDLEDQPPLQLRNQRLASYDNDAGNDRPTDREPISSFNHGKKRSFDGQTPPRPVRYSNQVTDRRPAPLSSRESPRYSETASTGYNNRERGPSTTDGRTYGRAPSTERTYPSHIHNVRRGRAVEDRRDFNSDRQPFAVPRRAETGRDTGMQDNYERDHKHTTRQRSLSRDSRYSREGDVDDRDAAYRNARPFGANHHEKRPNAGYASLRPSGPQRFRSPSPRSSSNFERPRNFQDRSQTFQRSTRFRSPSQERSTAWDRRRSPVPNNSQRRSSSRSPPRHTTTNRRPLPEQSELLSGDGYDRKPTNWEDRSERRTSGSGTRPNFDGKTNQTNKAHHNVHSSTGYRNGGRGQSYTDTFEGQRENDMVNPDHSSASFRERNYNTRPSDTYQGRERTQPYYKSNRYESTSQRNLQIHDHVSYPEGSDHGVETQRFNGRYDDHRSRQPQRPRGFEASRTSKNRHEDISPARGTGKAIKAEGYVSPETHHDVSTRDKATSPADSKRPARNSQIRRESSSNFDQYQSSNAHDASLSGHRDHKEEVVPVSPTKRIKLDQTQHQFQTPESIATPHSARVSKHSHNKRHAEAVNVSSKETSKPADSSSNHRVSTIDGSIYERIGQVGEGTYGKVYKACHRHTGELVALKRIRMEQERDGFPITSMREIKLLQRLRHPGVVNLLEMMIERSSVYMVFEYMDHDLTGVLANPSITFQPPHIKDLAAQLFDGLAYLHHRGVLHRDIKGSNILLNNAGELKLADFGLARFYQKSMANADYTNRVITLWFRPPELLLGATAYDSAVDIWSAGCILVELFTKATIFPGRDEINQLETIYQVMGSPTPESWPGVLLLPWYELIKFQTFPDKFAHLFEPVLSPAALDLSKQILSLDPSRRPVATEILKHAYFTTELPKAQRRTLFDISESHEWDTKQRRRDERAKKIKEEKDRGDATGASI